MLTVDQREEIPRAHFIEGRSIRQVPWEGRHDRRTVRKSLEDATRFHKRTIRNGSDYMTTYKNSGSTSMADSYPNFSPSGGPAHRKNTIWKTL